MLVLAGSSPLHPSQLASLNERIRQILPNVVSVDAVYVHYVQPTSTNAQATLVAQGSKERQIIDALLDYGDDYASDETRQAVLEALTGQQQSQPDLYPVFVCPRPRTISPWSSKATDIAKMCRLEQHVKRIERGTLYIIKSTQRTGAFALAQAAHLLHDRMTQTLLDELPTEESMFSQGQPKPLRTIEMTQESAKERLSVANKELGLALAADELDYLVNSFLEAAQSTGRSPTDAELFMFAQVNSEHCRHKIFNAAWTIDGKAMDHSLFAMIRNTHRLVPQHTLSAYSDNAAVIDGSLALRYAANASSPPVYTSTNEQLPILIKVETHNHPTAVSPFPGAATGSGGEIRDEGAVGRGSKPKAGLAGFTVSNLLVPGFVQPWETDFGKPAHIASAFDIMIDGPLGAAAFNNEFGRPGLTGYFRTFSESVPSNQGEEIRGYHKPIMIAGGYGHVRPKFALKQPISVGADIVVLGGPGMLIGLGGGAASSMVSGSSTADLDFASVQRENPEMQRRCQQVIDACVALDDENPIESIHDVGAGGLSNALPELVHDSGLGGQFEIRDVLVDDPSMSPMEIWCNESQERYVLAVSPSQRSTFEAIAKRERCPYSIVGKATSEQSLVVTDRLLKNDTIRLPMSILFGKPPRMSRTGKTVVEPRTAFDSSLRTYLPNATSSRELLQDAVERVLRLPTVASKSFLITIGDRSITGLVARDQMVGPWQVPVADVAVTSTAYGFDDMKTGEAMAMGERTPLALLSAPASARMAVAESLTNLAAASFESLAHVKLSANWMCAASYKEEGANLYAAVQAIGMDLCPALGVSIPVGKDSMSMSMGWNDERNAGQRKTVTAPLSVIITAFAPVDDTRQTWTPQLATDGIDEPTVLVFVDLANGKQRLGGSALAQVYKQIGAEAPDVEQAATLKAFLVACSTIRKEHPGLVLAYHDRSDGGLFTTVVEMCFAGRTGVELMIDTVAKDGDLHAALFNEELGAVFQVKQSDIATFGQVFVRSGVPATAIHAIGQVSGDRKGQEINIVSQAQLVWSSTRADLQSMWAETSYRMAGLRDSPTVAKEEFDSIRQEHDGLRYQLSYDPAQNAATPFLEKNVGLLDRPKVAILREQGVNGQIEMAWAFTAAGFTSVDVHMSDIISGRVSLADFKGVAACGGFSYGDVLGAGNGWAQSILLNAQARSEFEQFFNARSDTFALAVCNGCQLFSQLRDIIPGAESWPYFKRNMSGRFEGRTSLVKISNESKSIFLNDMGGSILPVAVAHGEGRVQWPSRNGDQKGESQVCVRYVDPATGEPTERYPFNPNGGRQGATGVEAVSGRVLALMPHPERVVRLEANSWYPKDRFEEWKGRGPWIRLFENARRWVG